MNIHNLIAGLIIMEKYRPPLASNYHVRAEHDAIYVGSLDWPIEPTDKMILENLGWSEDEEAEGYRALI